MKRMKNAFNVFESEAMKTIARSKALRVTMMLMTLSSLAFETGCMRFVQSVCVSYMPSIMTSALSRLTLGTAHANASALFLGASVLGGLHYVYNVDTIISNAVRDNIEGLEEMEKSYASMPNVQLKHYKEILKEIERLEKIEQRLSQKRYHFTVQVMYALSMNAVLGLCMYYNISSYVSTVPVLSYLVAPTLAMLGTNLLWAIGMGIAKKQMAEDGTIQDETKRLNFLKSSVSLLNVIHNGLILCSGVTGGYAYDYVARKLFQELCFKMAV